MPRNRHPSFHERVPLRANTGCEQSENLPLSTLSERFECGATTEKTGHMYGHTLVAIPHVSLTEQVH